MTDTIARIEAAIRPHIELLNISGLMELASQRTKLLIMVLQASDIGFISAPCLELQEAAAIARRTRDYHRRMIKEQG